MNKNRQIQFIDKIANLIDSGISMEETLSIILNTEENKKIKKIINEIREKIRKGISLSKSMTLSSTRFDQILISMIAYGEESGILSISIKQAKEILEKSKNIKKRLFGAMVYPSFIAISTLAMTAFLIIYIFPKIMPLFSSLNITLPFITRLVKKIYEYSIDYGLWTGISIIILFFLFIFLYKKIDKFKFNIQKMIISLPIIGEILKKYSLSINCRSIGILLEYGQSIPKILEKSESFAIFEPYKKVWGNALDEIMKGVSISDYMRKNNRFFPKLIPEMLSIGERTGTLGLMFKNLSRVYEDELDSFIKQISSFIEPILMIFMGIMVGGVALSIILPIYEITNHLSR